MFFYVQGAITEHRAMLWYQVKILRIHARGLGNILQPLSNASSSVSSVSSLAGHGGYSKFPISPRQYGVSNSAVFREIA